MPKANSFKNFLVISQKVKIFENSISFSSLFCDGLSEKVLFNVGGQAERNMRRKPPVVLPPWRSAEAILLRFGQDEDLILPQGSEGYSIEASQLLKGH
jgi:hypothetical protein